MSLHSQTSITIPGLSSVTINDKSAIVLDIGNKYTKVGVANEPLPRAIVPSTVYDVYTRRTVVVYDAERSRQQNTRIMKQFLMQLYNKHVCCNTKSQPVCVVESVLCSSQLRQIVAEVLFDLEVPAMTIVPSHTMAAMPFRASTALVVDMAHHETLAIPVVNGVFDLHRWQSSTTSGGRFVIDRTRALLLRYGTVVEHARGKEVGKEVIDRLLTLEKVEDIYVRSCFVTSLSRGRQWQEYDHAFAQNLVDGKTPVTMPDLPPIVADVEYELDADHLLRIPHFVRELVAEVFFATQDDKGVCLTEIILDVIVNSSIDARRSLASHIVLAGGGAHVLGLHKRLYEELGELYPKLCFDDDQFKFLRFGGKTPIYNCLAWIGGSMCAGRQYASINAKQFEEMGRVLPDWCSQEDTKYTPYPRDSDTPLESVTHDRSNEATPGEQHAVRRKESNAARAQQFTTESLLARAQSRLNR